MINQSMGTIDWAMLLLLSLLWGGSFFFISIVVTELPPLTIVLLRVGIAAITLWAMLLIAGYEVPKSLRLWRSFFILGLLNNIIPFALIVWGQNHIGAGLASLIKSHWRTGWLARRHCADWSILAIGLRLNHDHRHSGATGYYWCRYILWLRLGLWSPL
jgi:hypothetical protein